MSTLGEALGAITNLVCMGGLAGGVALAWWKWGHRVPTSPSVGKTLGLTWVDGELKGDIDGAQVRVWYQTVSIGSKTRKLAHLDVTIPGLPSDLRVVRQGPADRDLYLGDEAFDSAYRVDVSGLGWAFLSSARRDALSRSGASLERGVFTTHKVGDLSASWVQEVVRVAAEMAVADPVAQLLQMVETDPAEGVRAHALAALWDVAPDAVSEEKRFELSGAHGVLGGVALTWRTGRFGRLLLNETDTLVMVDILKRRREPLAVRDLVDLTDEYTSDLVWFRLCAASAEVLDPELGASLAAAALKREGSFGPDRAASALEEGVEEWREPLLLALLPRLDRSRAVVLAWMGSHASTAAVVGLDHILSGTWPMSDTREQAQRARDAIQARAVGQRGGLAIVDVPEAGALSESTSERGAVSVAGRSRVPER